MTDFITPFSPEYTIYFPGDPVTLVLLGAWNLLILIGLFLYRDKQVSFDRQRLSWLAILSALVLVLTPFFGVMLTPDLAGSSLIPPVRHFVVFAAVPWMVGAGVLGVLPAGLIAGISGLLLAYLDTHQIATPLLLMTCSLIFSRVIQAQRDTTLGRALQRPLVGAVFTWLISTPTIFIALMLSASGPLSLRFAAAFEGFRAAWLTLGGMIFVGGLAAALIRLVVPESWTAGWGLSAMTPRSELSRMLTQLGLIFLVLITLMVSSIWRISENTTRQTLVQELTDTAKISAEGLTQFIEIGTSQIESLADEVDLADQDLMVVEASLAQQFTSQSYFDQLGIFTLEGSLISSQPSQTPSQEGGALLTAEEIDAITQAGGGTSPVILAAPPLQGALAARIRFVMGIESSEEQVVRVLCGWVSLAENPLGALILDSLATLEEKGGVSQIIDNEGWRVYHTNPGLLLTEYASQRFSTSTFFEGAGQDDGPIMTYFQPIQQNGWAVVTAFPDEVRHLSTWELARPLILLGMAACLIVIFIVFLISFPKARELDQLKLGIEAAISGRQPPVGMGGQKRKSTQAEVFTQTLISLNRRVQQQRDLLTLYRPNGNLENLKEDLSQVMKAALAQGVSSVRIVLNQRGKIPSLLKNQGAFGLGRDSRLFAALDPQVTSLVTTEAPLVLGDEQVGQLLSLPAGVPYPASLLAFSLKSGEEWWGILWATYPATPDPGQDTVAFFRMLANRISDILAGYALVEGYREHREQLEQALNLIPQGVLLVDEKENVVYHNESLATLLGDVNQELAGGNLISYLEKNRFPELLDAIQNDGFDKEIRLSRGGSLHLKRERVEVNGVDSGSVLIFEPVNGFKTGMNTDIELVTIVSHALRSPLTLIHGYAKILRLTGNLNNQQDDYISKIINGIEEMRSLVQNLLELGRLESLGMVEYSEFKASQVLQKIKDSMAAQFRQKNIQLAVSHPEESITIRADFSLLTQAVKNLVDNALKFTKMGGKVSLSVIERDDKVVFSVKDTGPGIAPLDQRHLFENFQRAQGKQTDETSGSGLGLAIVRAIVDHHHGRVWVESQLGKGSIFFVEIPKRPA